MLIAIDLETVCNVENCSGYGKVYKCDHALHHLKNKITVIGAYWEISGNSRYKVFRDLKEFEKFIQYLPPAAHFVGHNFKFDLKTLSSKISAKTYSRLESNWTDDSTVMGAASSTKVTKDYLESYDKKRVEINSKYKTRHRKAGQYSLKTMAPFFLGVKPFWEKDDKDDDEYVIKDCEYSYKLCKYFEEFLKVDGTYDFYKEKLMKWNKLLMDMELAGIKLDMAQLEDYEKEVKKEYEEKLKDLLARWKKGIAEYEAVERNKIILDHRDKIDKAIQKTRDTKLWSKLKSHKKEEKLNKVIKKKLDVLDKQLEEFEGFNMNSDQQMLWLLKDYYGYECVNDKGKFSVGKDVKEKLIEHGHEDIILYDEVGKLNKLLTSFFPSYKEKQIDQIIYGNFRIEGTKTGRLSSSNPNLQQCPASIKKMFVSRPGYKFISRDVSALEPNIIAYFSEDPVLCNILLNGEDFHGEATRSMIEYVTCPSTEVKANYKAERNMVKQADLSLFYGTGKNGLVRTAKKHRFNWSVEEAAYKLKQFKKKFAGVFKFKQDLDAQLEAGKSIYNILGRKIQYSDPTEVYMKGFNGLIQGSGSDLVLHATYKTHEALKEKGWGRALILEHDAVIFEVKEEVAEQADELFCNILSDFKLETQHGTLTLKTEGGIYDYWDH